MSDERPDRPDVGPDEPLPGPWLEAARAYNDPPDTPREEIWSVVEARLGRPAGDAGSAARVGRTVLRLDHARERRGRRSGLRWLGAAAAAAAVLAVGIGIGRMTAPSGVTVAGGGALPPPDAPAASPAVRAAAFEHLGRSESLLTMVRADARAGRLEGDVAGWGRGLLAETRLLLDSSAADDPAMRALLEDLELILAQVAVLEGGAAAEPGRAREELEIIARGLEERDVLSRIQAVLPAGPEAITWGI